VTPVGRNYPCPCGSGLKFKRCCLNKTGAAVKVYSKDQRHSVLAKLMRFSARAEFKGSHEAALKIFWGDWLLEEPDEELKRVMGLEQVEIAYNSWFAFDFDLSAGRRPVDCFLEREGEKLNPGERNYLEWMRHTHLRLYEILAVKVDQGFNLRDLWDDETLWVTERLATQHIVTWDVIAARVSRGENGETVLETIPHIYPAAAKDDLLKDLRKAHRVFTRRFPKKSIADFFKSMAPFFHQSWLERVALRPFPKVRTAEGDPFIFAKVIFEVKDRGAVLAKLGGHADVVDHGDGTYAWLEPAGVFQRSLGTIVIEAGRLVLESTSKRRAERGQERLESLLEEAVRFKAISYEDVGQALKHRPNPAAKEKPAVSPELEAELLQRFYEEHYRKWPDEPLPALGNRTPRYAARLKTLRPKLVALLKDFESQAERQRRAGQPAYDFSWIWNELGLSRW
jgi:hypothetical protein